MYKFNGNIIERSFSTNIKANYIFYLYIETSTMSSFRGDFRIRTGELI